MTTRRLARTKRKVDDPKHRLGPRTFGIDRRIRQMYCAYDGRPVLDDDNDLLHSDYYLCALCAECRAQGRERVRVDDDTDARTRAEYPRHPDDPILRECFGDVDA